MGKQSSTGPYGTVADDTGRNEIFVQPFPPTGAKWQISNSGGRQPLWREDGKEVFFVADDRKFYAVGHSRRDGQRFLVNMILDSASAPINVVLNWTTGQTKGM